MCGDMHARLSKKSGETDERLFTVAAWRDAPYFTDAERAALLTEAERASATGPIQFPTRSGTKPPVITTRQHSLVSISPSRQSMYGTG